MPPNSLWLDRPDRRPYRAVDFAQRYDTVVIGGGLTGLITALLFASTYDSPPAKTPDKVSEAEDTVAVFQSSAAAFDQRVKV